MISKHKGPLTSILYGMSKWKSSRTGELIHKQTSLLKSNLDNSILSTEI
jgi:hypothetical protein